MERARRTTKPKSTHHADKHRQNNTVYHENQTGSLDFLAQDSFQASDLKPEQVLKLQRQLGNQATLNLISGQPTQKSLSRMFLQPYSNIQRDAVVLDDDEYSESDSEDSERDVPMDYDDDHDEELDLPDAEVLRDEMAKIGKQGILTTYGNEALNKLLIYLGELLIDKGESVLSETEIDILYDRATNLPHLLQGLAPKVIEASPTMSARVEAGKAEDRLTTYDHVMSMLRDEYMSDFQAEFLLLAKRFYYKPPKDFPYTDELKSLVETETWSWLLSKDMQTAADARILFEARRKLQESQKDADSTDIDPLDAITGGSVKTLGGIGQVITVTEGVDILSEIDKDTKGKDMVTHGLEGLFERIMAKAFAPIAIGYDLIKAFKYHKTRRDGYAAAMERSGMSKDGTTDVKPDTPEDVEKIRLGNVAYYAYKKTRRAFWGSIISMALKTVKWIAYALTVLSGGTTAVVTGAIALSADITRALIGISSKLKGFWKAITGKRGAMRKKNAQELMTLANSGNEDAIQTIWDVNPFDEVRGISKDAWNATKGLGIFVDMTKLPKPDSLEDFKESFKTGYYSDRKVQAVLTTALKNTMSSQ